MAPPLLLRDLHATPAPSWWPPAPGWWLLAGLVLLAMAAWVWRRRRQRRHRARVAAVFDRVLAAAESPPQAVAAMSELLRRAARRHHPDADRLQGEAWLALLDGDAKPAVFDTPHGRLLLDGAFRPRLDADEVECLRRIARARFVEWMLPR